MRTTTNLDSRLSWGTKPSSEHRKLRRGGYQVEKTPQNIFKIRGGERVWEVSGYFSPGERGKFREKKTRTEEG